MKTYFEVINESKKKSQGKLENIFVLSDREDATCQTLWDAGKTSLRGQFTTLSVYVRKDKKICNNYLNSHLKKLEKQDNIHTI